MRVHAISGYAYLLHHAETAMVAVGATVLGLFAVTTEGVKDGLAIAGGIVLLLGVLWRIVIIPNLRREFGDPINKTHKLAEKAMTVAEDTNRQVTQNGGKSTPPTVPDLIGQVLERLDRLEKRQIKAATGHEELVGEVHRHFDWSNDIVVKLTQEIAQKQDRE